MADSAADAELEGPRSAQVDEREAILETIDLVHRTSVGRPPSMARDYPHVYAPDNLENVFVVKAGEKVVCSTGVWVNEVQLGGARLRTGGINSVATLPEFRKRGLGMAVMRMATGHMRELGCHVGLLGTDISNWYRRLGWEYGGIERSYRLDRGNIGLLPTLPQDIMCEAFKEEMAEQVLAVHHADRLGGIRTPGLFDQLLSAKKVSNAVVARRDSEVIAYLLIRGQTAVEWGGPVEVVAGLVRAWFEDLDDPESSTSTRDADFRPVGLVGLTVTTPGGGHPLVTVLEDLGIPYSMRYAGMILLMDSQGVLEAFGHRDIVVSEEEEKVGLRRGTESETLTRNAMVKLFFGPERVSNFASDVFPLPFYQWVLEHV